MDTSNLVKQNILMVLGAAKAISLPSPKTPPKNISSSALKIWPEFLKKYGKNIKSVGSDPIDQWKVAVAIFRNYCLKRSIPPFDAQASYLNQETQDYMRNRLYINRNKLFEKGTSTLSFLVKKGLVKKVIKETVSDINYNKNKSVYSISTKSVLVLPKQLNNKSKEVIQVLKNKGFDKKKDELIYSVGTHTITIVPDDKSDRLVLTNTLNFTPQHIKYILGIEDKDLKDVKSVVKKLAKEAKNFLKRDSLNTMVVSSITKKLDFYQELPVEQKEILDNTVKDLQNTKLSDIRARFSLDTVRSLGDPLYQFNLIKALLNIYDNSKDEDKKKVDVNVWQSVIENPDNFLNPENIKKNDIKDTNDPDSNV